MLIYKITNKLTNKSYIGQTKRTLENRFKAHLYEARTYKYNMYLHNSIRKYGDKVFIIDLIEECSADDVAERERYWIRSLNTLQPNGYNEHEGGKGGCLNASPELREKLSKAKKGKFVPWNKGLTKTDPRVARNGIGSSLGNKGKPKSETHKDSLRKPKRKRKCLFTEDTS